MIGRYLPEIFEHNFRRKYTINRNVKKVLVPTIGNRFVREVLDVANIRTPPTRPYSLESIVKYYRLRKKPSRRKAKLPE